MEAQAKTTNVRISPRKVRLVADAMRGMSVVRALDVLAATKKHGASILYKTLKSAVANYLQKGDATEAQLFITTLEVDGGPILRRMHVGSRSHMRMYTKRSTHIKVVVGDKKAAKEELKPVIKEEKKITELKTKKGNK